MSDVEVDEMAGKWYILQSGFKLAGPFNTSSEAWKEVDRKSTQETWVSSKNKFRNSTEYKA